MLYALSCREHIVKVMKVNLFKSLVFFFWVLASLFPLSLRSQAQLQIHPNKSVYLPGEYIWFSTYFFDHNKTAVEGTQMIRVQLLNAVEEVVKEEIFSLTNGIGSGQILVAKDREENRLFLMAEILQDKDAAEPIQDLRIIDLLNAPQIKQKFPAKGQGLFHWASESGAILPGKQNTLLFYLPPNANVKDLGFYEGSTSLEVDLENKWKGMGQFTYYHDPTKKYKFILQKELNAPEYFPVAPSDQRTAGLRINNIEGESARIGVLSSDLSKEVDGTLEFMYKGTSLVFEAEMRVDQEFYSVPRNALPEGVIQVRLRSEGIIKAQNWFLNRRSLTSVPMDILAVEKEGDSVYLQLQWSGKEQMFHRFSASVMTKEAYDQMQFRDLESMAMLGEVIGRSQIPSFLKKNTRNKQARLDHWLRLFINSNQISRPLADNKKPISGFVMSGSVGGADADEASQVMIQSRSGVFSIIPLKKDKSFSTEFLTKANDSLFATALNAKGQAVKKGDCIVKMEAKEFADFSSNTAKLLQWFQEEEERPELHMEWADGLIALDEVTLSAPIKTFQKFQINAEVEGRSITPEEEKRYATLSTYLKRMGYRVNSFGGKIVVWSRGVGPGVATGSVVVPVLVNGLFSDGYDIFQLPLTSVQSVTS